MKLLISFIDPEINFLLQQSKIIKKEILFKDKTQISIFFHLKYKNNDIFLVKLGMGALFSLSSLQKIIDSHKIKEVLIFGSCGSLKENLSKVVLINKFSFLNKSFLYENTILKSNIDKYKNKFKDLEIFQNVSADKVVHEKEITLKNKNISFDMEKSYIAYNLQLNNIPFTTIVTLTDNGNLNFKNIKKIYNENSTKLNKVIDYFLE